MKKKTILNSRRFVASSISCSIYVTRLSHSFTVPSSSGLKAPLKTSMPPTESLLLMPQDPPSREAINGGLLFLFKRYAPKLSLSGS